MNKASVWSTIDTAPTDGSHFLAIEVVGPMNEYDEDGLILKRDVYEKNCVVAYCCFGDFITYPYTGSIVRNRRFTHWMPLPTFPEARP